MKREKFAFADGEAADRQLVLDQATGEKSNGITAAPKLPQRLSLTGAVVTTDARIGPRSIAAGVIQRVGDDVLALKGRQGTLRADAKLFSDEPAHATELTSHRVAGADHRRIEARRASVCRQVERLQQRRDWPGLIAFGKGHADARDRIRHRRCCHQQRDGIRSADHRNSLGPNDASGTVCTDCST